MEIKLITSKPDEALIEKRDTGTSTVQLAERRTTREKEIIMEEFTVGPA